MDFKKRNALENERRELSDKIAAIEVREDISKDRKEQDVYNCELRISVIDSQLSKK